MNAPVMIPTAATPAERILARFDRSQLAGFIAVAIDLLDMADGDPDLEPSGFHEGYSHDARSADQRDAATYLAAHEDDEDDDPAEDDGTGDEDDDPREDDDASEEDDHAGGDANDEGEVTWLESVSQLAGALAPLEPTSDDDEPRFVPADMHTLAQHLAPG